MLKRLFALTLGALMVFAAMSAGVVNAKIDSSDPNVNVYADEIDADANFLRSYFPSGEAFFVNRVTFEFKEGYFEDFRQSYFFPKLETVNYSNFVGGYFQSEDRGRLGYSNAILTEEFKTHILPEYGEKPRIIVAKEYYDADHVDVTAANPEGELILVKVTENPAEVIGDMNLDGETNARDYLMVKRMVLKTLKPAVPDQLSSVFEKYVNNQLKRLADVNFDGEINIKDYVALKKHVLKIADKSVVINAGWENAIKNFLANELGEHDDPPVVPDPPVIDPAGAPEIDTSKWITDWSTDAAKEAKKSLISRNCRDNDGEANDQPCDLSEWKVETVNGVPMQVCHCKKCGQKYTRQIDKFGHEYYCNSMLLPVEGSIYDKWLKETMIGFRVKILALEDFKKSNIVYSFPDGEEVVGAGWCCGITDTRTLPRDLAATWFEWDDKNDLFTIWYRTNESGEWNKSVIKISEQKSLLNAKSIGWHIEEDGPNLWYNPA